MSNSSSATINAGIPTPEAHWKETLKDGATVLIRPIHADDEALERRLIEGLSSQTRRFRFLGEIKTPSAAMLQQLTHPDPKLDVAFVALVADGAVKREVGVARFSTRPDLVTCECAVVVDDGWQGRGLATILMHHLIEIARERGIECMYSVDIAKNPGARELFEHLGFTRKPDPTDGAQVLHTLDLKSATV